jgi:hypothetical protein
MTVNAFSTRVHACNTACLSTRVVKRTRLSFLILVFDQSHDVQLIALENCDASAVAVRHQRTRGDYLYVS